MKKIITYSSPKELKTNQEYNKWFSKRPKVCKATKGEHIFSIVKATKMFFIKEIMFEYRCLCGKKKIEFRKEADERIFK